MPKRGENIYKRKDGRWEARYVKGYDLSGKIIYGSCYGKTCREARAKAAVCRAALVSNYPLPGQESRTSFAACCDEWLVRQRSRVKESTFIKYRAILECHIKPFLGHCCLRKLSTSLVESFKSELLEQEKLSAATVRGVLIVLRSVLMQLRKEYPGSVPAVEITYPRAVKQEVRVLSVEEQTRLTAYLQEDMDYCKFGILLALLTGLRIGELCALRWKDISIEDRVLKVTATMQRLQSLKAGGPKTQVIIGSPKSESSARTIPMSDSAASLCCRMAVQSPDIFVLTGTPKFMEPRALQCRMKKYCQACGLEGVHFHTLRHTFATRCVEVGFELKSLSEILGHSSTTVTMDRYVHSSMELKRRNMAKLSSVGL